MRRWWRAKTAGKPATAPKATAPKPATKANPASAPKAPGLTALVGLPKAKPAATPQPGAHSDAVFPSAVSPKYSSESPGKARMHTCLDQYRANKTSSGNGGLKWIEKGGGYYSECNKRLKG